VTRQPADRARWTAALPMYDLPEIRGATDAWWAGIARHLRAAGLTGVPDGLTRADTLRDVWDDPDLLVGQGCGYPFTHAYAGRWQYLATPVYGVPGCEGPAYRSWLIVGAGASIRCVDDLSGRTAAVNAADSHSGWIALRAALADRGMAPDRALSGIVWTGGHRASVRAVADGEVDVAAVDCVTHALLAAHEPDALACTRILAGTPSAPGLPLVAGRHVDRATRARVRAALWAALGDPELNDCRRALRIGGLRVLPQDAYARVRNMAAAGGVSAVP
jgi:ABC-type phosphate/phosphonate transport system substrate-binding protein